MAGPSPPSAVLRSAPGNLFCNIPLCYRHDDLVRRTARSYWPLRWCERRGVDDHGGNVGASVGQAGRQIRETAGDYLGVLGMHHPGFYAWIQLETLARDRMESAL